VFESSKANKREFLTVYDVWVAKNLQENLRCPTLIQKVLALSGRGIQIFFRQKRKELILFV
jgi:hypothetical protein